MATRAYPYHAEIQGIVPAPADALFAHVDDPVRLAAHMSRPSWQMVGTSMKLETDAGHGKSVGSHIRMNARMFGIVLSLDEVVIERVAPMRKVWETVGAPRLLVIGHYRMGFELETYGASTRLRVFIDYTLPDGPITRLLGRLFGRYYASWCTERMLKDATRYFADVGAGAPPAASAA
jgi:hypothetical protein